MALSREALLSGPRMVLLRHGQCIDGKEGRFNGRRDRPLSELGIEQRLYLPERFLRLFGDCGIQAVYSSEMLRAQMTAQPLAEAIGQERPYVLPNFQERNLGRVTGLTAVQAIGMFRQDELIRTSHTTYAFSKRHGMETGPETIARVLGVLDLVSSMHDSSDTVVLVGHGDAIRAGMAGYLGVPITEVLDLKIGYTEGVVLNDGMVQKLAA